MAGHGSAPGLACCSARDKGGGSKQGSQGSQLKCKEALCSWCYEHTVHYYVTKLQFYMCDACKGKTTPSTASRDCMARIEHGKVACAKSDPNYQEVMRKKNETFAREQTVQEIFLEMQRDSRTKQQAVEEGLVRPFLLLVSMSPPLRALLAVHLGWCPFVQPALGDAHEEAWDILTKKNAGLRARCLSRMGKLNPFAHERDWVGLLNHIARVMFIPSYMSWSDTFTSEKLGREEGLAESSRAHSKKVDLFECEVIEKVWKQQRSKMNKFQMSFITQLLATADMKQLLALQAKRGWDRHNIALLAIDCCYLQLSRDKHLEKTNIIEPEEIASLMTFFLSPRSSIAASILDEAGVSCKVRIPPPSSVLSAFWEPLWLMMGTLQVKPFSPQARFFPVIIQILLQKERLKLCQISLSSPEFSRPERR